MESYTTAHPQTRVIKMTSQIGLNKIHVSVLHWLQAHSITPRAFYWLTAYRIRDVQDWPNSPCKLTCYDIASLPPNIFFPCLGILMRERCISEKRDFIIRSKVWQGFTLSSLPEHNPQLFIGNNFANQGQIMSPSPAMTNKSWSRHMTPLIWARQRKRDVQPHAQALAVTTGAEDKKQLIPPVYSFPTVKTPHQLLLIGWVLAFQVTVTFINQSGTE